MMRQPLHLPPPLGLRPGRRGGCVASRRDAFTLVEVLAALVLIGIVLPITMKGISLALSAANHAKRSVEAASLAESKLAELVVTREWQFGIPSGTFGDEWPDYQWTAEIFHHDTSLIELTVHVTWMARQEERNVSLSTLVYTEGQL